MAKNLNALKASYPVVVYLGTLSWSIHCLSDHLLIHSLFVLLVGIIHLHHASRQLCFAVLPGKPVSGSPPVIFIAPQQQAVGQVRMEPSSRLGQASQGSLGSL